MVNLGETKQFAVTSPLPSIVFPVRTLSSFRVSLLYYSYSGNSERSSRWENAVTNAVANRQTISILQSTLSFSFSLSFYSIFGNIINYIWINHVVEWRWVNALHWIELNCIFIELNWTELHFNTFERVRITSISIIVFLTQIVLLLPTSTIFLHICVCVCVFLWLVASGSRGGLFGAGGRFKGGTDPIMEKFNESIHFDKR